jgi:tetratricopeptide (TPR) repeat protein
MLSGLLRRRRLWAAVALVGFFAAAVALVGPHVRAWYHYRAAQDHLQRYHTVQAVRHLQACLRIWPSAPDVLLLAACAARRAGAYDEAEVCLDRYRRARGLDEAGNFEQLLLSAERGGDDHVVRHCRRLVEQDHPQTSLLLEALARGFLREYRLPEARFCLDLWLRKEPDNPQALCLQGQVHLDYEHLSDRAADRYRRAIEIDPDHEEALLGLSISLLESKLFDEAIPHLQRLLQRQPGNLRVQVGLAECRAALDDPDEAIRLLDEVLARQPKFAPALALRGRLAVERGEYQAAEALLLQAVQGAPSDQAARYNLVLCLNHNGKSAEAKQHQQWLEQRKEDLKRFEIVTRDLAQRPRDPALLSTIGELLLRSEFHEQGVQWLRSALRQDPQYAPARKALAEYYRKEKTAQQCQ